ncbi:DDE_3 domain-containing protein [Trichonephila clavipes]|nr:DDE_3 domain-containing protein [Trichonephila clavipes]
MSSKDMTSYHGLQDTRSFANRACLDALGRQLQPSRDTGELTAQMQRLWQDLPQGVISDLIESMPRRISACIAARGGFTTY